MCQRIDDNPIPDSCLSPSYITAVDGHSNPRIPHDLDTASINSRIPRI